ncbi:hypothetical protein D8M04_04290 [Oceanobacillus piezotolerans]|uniref:Uncharacterized protein n=1 Tax=Oceanobacillus piezotolerans TaxID=2448030 RepID=A0A498DBH9_9BACI|nr:hypothetical protein [Oceanobacillus piezotolerans]RLL48484.1 hypothetical protein D8M04_04290 [Oceanobacillus piezotolerans]
MSGNRVTPIQGLIIVSIFALIIIAIIFASQFYFSYVEVTEAANNCFNRGGHPIIEKTGLEMTYFECITN